MMKLEINLWIRNPAKGVENVPLNRWQEKTLGEILPGNNIILAPRQTGKTTFLNLLCIENAINKISHSLFISWDPIGSLNSLKLLLVSNKINYTSRNNQLILFNGSIIYLKQDKQYIRGKFDFVYFDEASFLNHKFIKKIHDDILSIITPNSQIIMISSASAKKGIFYDIWNNPIYGFYRHEWKLSADEFMVRMGYANYPELMIRREFLNEFVN